MQDERDAAEFDEASYSVDFAAHCDGTPTSEPVTSHRRAAESLMHTLNHFLFTDRPTLIVVEYIKCFPQVF